MRPAHSKTSDQPHAFSLLQCGARKWPSQQSAPRCSCGVGRESVRRCHVASTLPALRRVRDGGALQLVTRSGRTVWWTHARRGFTAKWHVLTGAALHVGLPCCVRDGHTHRITRPSLTVSTTSAKILVQTQQVMDSDTPFRSDGLTDLVYASQGINREESLLAVCELETTPIFQATAKRPMCN